MISCPQIYGGGITACLSFDARIDKNEPASGECGVLSEHREKCPFFLAPDYCIKNSRGFMKKTLERIKRKG